MEQRAAMKFCTKLKKTAAARFDMLESAYCEEDLCRTKVQGRDQKVRMQNSSVKTTFTACFHAVLSHPPNSIDLAPADSFYFSN
jgi:CRISPR/Cas system endoribonuclease Cas6 (RAMP superfamily)